MSNDDRDLTGLLIEWGGGDKAAVDELMSLVFPELQRLARSHLRRERQGHTLQTNALINEAYLRLVDQDRVEWANRGHFFGICARMMRRILVDHARKQNAAKRGGPIPNVTLDEGRVGAKASGAPVDVVALDEALKSLAELDPRQAEIVEFRYFAGLTIEETAQIMGLGAATIKREWATAKIWLRRELSAPAGDPAGN